MLNYKVNSSQCENLFAKSLNLILSQVFGIEGGYGEDEDEKSN